MDGLCDEPSTLKSIAFVDNPEKNRPSYVKRNSPTINSSTVCDVIHQLNPSSKLPLRCFLARISACPTARPVSGFGRRFHSVRACEGSGARLHVRGFPWASG